MSYPGDSNLDPKVQQRILKAFGEAARLYRDGHAEESRTILRSIVEVDPRFTPAQRLDNAIDAGVEVDLGELLGEVSAAAPVNADEIIRGARAALEAGDYQGALVLAQSLLRELPGHEEARRVALEAQTRARKSSREEPAAAPPAGPPAAAEKPHHAPPPAPEAPSEEDLDLFTAPDEDATGVRGAASPDVPPEGGAEGGDAEDDEFAFDVVDEAPSDGPAEGSGAATGADDAGMSFGAGTDMEFGAAGGDDDERMTDLLQRGQAAFDSGDFQEAIDTWSRIFLIDAHHGEAERRIEQARRRREEVDRLAEHHFYEAREAFDRGDMDEARRLCSEVLQLQPQHLEAHDLLQRIDTPSAPPPPPAVPAGEGDEDEDIFNDDFVPEMLASPSSAEFGAVHGDGDGEGGGRRRQTERRGGVRRPQPTALVVGIGAAIVAVVIAVLFFGGGMFSGGASSADEVLAEAERLAAEGRYQEAVTLLRAAEVDDDLAPTVSRKILDYTRQLRSRPTPVPKTDLSVIRKAISEGHRFEAMRLIDAGLDQTPGEPGLVALKQEIADYAPSLPGLVSAAAAGRWQPARERAVQLREEHPGDPEAVRAWEATTFNLALQMLRKYEIATAHRLLGELSDTVSDPQVDKLEDLAESYLSRPVDPRYEIFLESVDFRSIGP